MAVDRQNGATERPAGQDVTRRNVLQALGAGTVGWTVAAAGGPATASPPQTGREAKDGVAGEKGSGGRKDRARITLVQLTDNDKGKSALARMPAFFEKASGYGSDLIVFPEYILGRHITVEHERVRRFLALAREHHIYAIAGLVEDHGNKWSTTALMADRSGNLLGRYFKCHPASGGAPHWWPPVKDRDSEACGILGNQFTVFHLDFAPVGILQCYDGYFPEAWGCTSFSGAEIILWINGRGGPVEDSHCIFASRAYGCVVGAAISNGWNSGFTAPRQQFIIADGEPEEMRLFPRIKEAGDGCVHAAVDLAKLRWHRKHLRTMHQRRPELYGRLTEDIKIWQDYPDIPWDSPECEALANKAQLEYPGT